MLSHLPAAAAGLLTLTSLLSTVSAARDSKTVEFKFEKRWVSDFSEETGLRKRQNNVVNSEISNEQLLYFINVTVGTPGQPFSLQLDTGSSDIWFPASNADVCQQNQMACAYGTYDASKSSTFKELNNLGQFQIQYVDGSQISGVYISDVLNIGSTQLTNTTMAAATTASRGIGIMGVGFQSGESSNTGSTDSFTYPNVINVLKNEGKIETLSYSLWLDDLDAQTGSILFGGVDTDKYHGNLVALPIQDDSQSGQKTSFTVAWTGLTITGGGQTSDLSPSSAQPAILDSGTSLTYVPNDIANNIFNAFGVYTDPNYGNLVPCEIAGNDFNITFEFGGKGGASVAVPLSEFVVPLTTETGKSLHFKNGQEACTFGLDSAGSDPILFGDTFLRSAYVVYDLENLSIGLAQTNFNGKPSEGNVQAIGSSGIPDVASTAAAVTVQQTFTGNPLNTAGAGATASGTGSLGGGTSRSASLHLTATAAASGSSGGGSSNAAPSSLKSVTSVAAVVVTAFAFGFAMIIM